MGEGWQAPVDDGQIVAWPDRSAWAELAAANQRRLESASASGLGRLSELRKQARSEALERSRAYHERFGHAFPGAAEAEHLWILSGHQPDFVHPGVWVKHFATAGLARHLTERRQPATSVHVIADGDTLKQATVLVPAGRPEAPMIAHIPFDVDGTNVPFEDRPVTDESLFSDFGRRAAEAMARYPFRPILPEYWLAVCQARSASRLLGERLAHGRRTIERSWGCENVELPLGALCEGEAFARFAAAYAARAGEFADIHNRLLADHRRRHRIRDSHHPVPALEADSAAVEIPFWLWQSGGTGRSRAFIRKHEGAWHLFADKTPVQQLPAPGADAAEDIAASLLHGLGNWRLRPRALTTSAFLRLCLADLFLHGIGGGKYDDLGDAISREFLGIDMPDFAVLSATLYLPTASAPVDLGPLRALERLARDQYWNPDRYLEEHLREQEPLAGWIEEKFELQAREPESRPERRQRFERFRAIQDRLRPYLGTLPADTHAELARERERVRLAERLHSREFASCLHPADRLRELTRRCATF